MAGVAGERQREKVPTSVPLRQSDDSKNKTLHLKAGVFVTCDCSCLLLICIRSFAIWFLEAEQRGLRGAPLFRPAERKKLKKSAMQEPSRGDISGGLGEIDDTARGRGDDDPEPKKRRRPLDVRRRKGWYEVTSITLRFSCRMMQAPQTARRKNTCDRACGRVTRARAGHAA